MLRGSHLIILHRAEYGYHLYCVPWCRYILVCVWVKNTWTHVNMHTCTYIQVLTLGIDYYITAGSSSSCGTGGALWWVQDVSGGYT